jgi:hypothetical protein
MPIGVVLMCLPSHADPVEIVVTKKQVAEDIFHVMDFGKYSGKSVGEVFEIDPTYLRWAHNNTERFKLSDSMYNQLLEHLTRLNIKNPYKNPFMAKIIKKETDWLLKDMDDQIPF